MNRNSKKISHIILWNILIFGSLISLGQEVDINVSQEATVIINGKKVKVGPDGKTKMNLGNVTIEIGVNALSRQDAVKTYNLFRTSYKEKNYQEAFKYWYQCFKQSPKLSVNIYRQGPKLIKEIRKTTSDFNGNSWDLLIKKIYDNYFELLSNKNFELEMARKYAFFKKFELEMTSKYASFLQNLKDHSILGDDQSFAKIGDLYACVFDCFDKIYKKDPSVLSPKSLALYFKAVIDKNANDANNMSIIFDTYDKLLEATNEKIKKYNKKLDSFNERLERGNTLSSREKKMKKSYEINLVATGRIETILDKYMI